MKLTTYITSLKVLVNRLNFSYQPAYNSFIALMSQSISIGQNKITVYT